MEALCKSSKNFQELQEPSAALDFISKLSQERKIAFNRLAQTFVRMFYDDLRIYEHHSPKRSDAGRGIAVVVVDALTRRQWVSEQDLAMDLKLQPRHTLVFLEQEKLIFRERIKKGVKIYNAPVAATADGQPFAKEGRKKIKLHSHFYYSLDYAQIYDVARYKIHHMKKKLKDELESNNAVQDYICTNCERRYNSLDALRLVSEEDYSFHCEHCNGKLVAGNARGQRHEKLKDMFQRLEVQLKPLMEQIDDLKDLDVPNLGTLQAWDAQASTAGCPEQMEILIKEGDVDIA